MTKQQEIREGMWMLLVRWDALPKQKRVRHHLVDEMLEFQSAEGVVLKVDRKIDEVLVGVLKSLYNRLDVEKDLAELKALGYVSDMFRSNFEAVESII